MTEQQTKTANKIFNVLTRQAFAQWYQTGHFDSYIRVEIQNGKPSLIGKKDILNDITSLFGVTEKGTIE